MKLCDKCGGWEFIEVFNSNNLTILVECSKCNHGFVTGEKSE